MEKKIEEFWEVGVWKCNINHIHNKRIKDVLIQIQKLTNPQLSKKQFFLLSGGDFEIKSNNKIIEKIKKEEINYIKTHADCIPEYHNLIIELKKESLYL
jgi:hypothetical protein